MKSIMEVLISLAVTFYIDNNSSSFIQLDKSSVFSTLAATSDNIIFFYYVQSSL